MHLSSGLADCGFFHKVVFGGTKIMLLHVESVQILARPREDGNTRIFLPGGYQSKVLMHPVLTLSYYCFLLKHMGQTGVQQGSNKLTWSFKHRLPPPLLPNSIALTGRRHTFLSCYYCLQASFQSPTLPLTPIETKSLMSLFLLCWKGHEGHEVIGKLARLPGPSVRCQPAGDPMCRSGSVIGKRITPLAVIGILFPVNWKLEMASLHKSPLPWIRELPVVGTTREEWGRIGRSILLYMEKVNGE